MVFITRGYPAITWSRRRGWHNRAWDRRLCRTRRVRNDRVSSIPLYDSAGGEEDVHPVRRYEHAVVDVVYLVYVFACFGPSFGTAGRRGVRHETKSVGSHVCSNTAV